MNQETRRSFNRKMLGSITTLGLIELLYESDLFGKEIKPTLDAWMVDLYELCRDVKVQKVKQIDWQKQLETLYKKVSLPDLLKFVKLEQIKKNVKLRDNGAVSTGVNLSSAKGVPARLPFGKQIFCLKKGRSIVPHGHNNMCTGFIVLSGEFHGRHYDRVKDAKDHYLIKPTIDRQFKPGECSTISDEKDNIHWFKALSETGFIFNVHVLGVTKPDQGSGRAYLDPEGQKLDDGLIIAKKMTSRQCHQKFG